MGNKDAGGEYQNLKGQKDEFDDSRIDQCNKGIIGIKLYCLSPSRQKDGDE